jgi:TonB-linked SusC/RagA family outer membrane protein
MKKFLLLSFMLAFAFASWAQERTISGRVTSTDDGSPLPGVNVVLKGTTTGTVTDAEGRYSIAVPGPNASIVFSFIGLQTQEVVVGDRTVVDVSLALDVTQLSEIVVTGVGAATEKRKVAIDVASVTGKNLVPSAVGSIDQAIQGKIAGSQVQLNSGQPGAAANIQLRGLNALGASNPIILVDGVQIGTTGQNALAGLDMTNVDRIEVVKGAAGGMLYGAQGGNGVIQIFTKKGSKDRKLSITVNSKYIVDKAIIGKTDIVASKHHYDTNGAGLILSTGGVPLSQDPITRTWTNPNVSLGPDLLNDKSFEEKTYDHLDQVYRTAVSQNTSVNVSGGTEKYDYSLNINYLNQENVRFGALKRYNIGLNLGTELAKGLTLRSTTQLILERDNLQSGNRFALVNSYQWINFNDRYDNGYLVIKPKDENEFNPLSQLEWRSRQGRATRIIQNFNLNYKFPKFVEVDYKYGVQLGSTNDRDITRNQQGFLEPSDAFWGPAPGTGQATFTNSRSVYQNSLLSAFVRFDFRNDFNMSIPLSSTTQIAYDWRKDEYEDFFGQGSGFAYPPYTLGTAATKNSGSSSVDRLTFGYLVNQTFEWGSLAGVSVGFRTDYGSAFGFNADGGAPKSFTFPRATAFFNPSELLESDKLTAWKVRVAWGKAGIQPEPYARQPVLSSGTYGDAPGLFTQDLGANAALKIQETTELELGTDITVSPGISDSWLTRIDVGFTYWDRSSANVIMNLPVAPSSGAGSYIDNVADLSSKGIDLSLDANAFQSTNFSWNLGLRLGSAKTTVDKVTGGISIPYQYTGGTNPINVFIIQEGQPLGNFIGQVPVSSLTQRDANGDLYIDPADIDDYQVVKTKYGNVVVDKVSRTALMTSTDDKKNMGNAQPKFFGSIINDFTIFKFITVNMQWDFSKGNKIYNVTRQWLYRDRLSKDFDLPVTIDGERGAYVAFYNSLYNSVQPSGWFVEDGSYMRLRNLSVNVDLSNYVKLKWTRNISVTFSGRNLLTITKYRGLDPEATSVGSQAVGNGVAALPVRGVDDFSFPNLKSYQVGITVGI